MSKQAKKTVPAKAAKKLQMIPASEGAVSALFRPVSEVKFGANVKVTSMSPMLPPQKFPADSVLSGVFTRIFKTKEFGSEEEKKQGQGKQGYGVEIIPVGAKVGVSLPLVATLKMGLQVGVVDGEPVSALLGKVVHIQLLPEKLPSKKGQAAWNYLVGYEEES